MSVYECGNCSTLTDFAATEARTCGVCGSTDLKPTSFEWPEPANANGTLSAPAFWSETRPAPSWRRATVIAALASLAVVWVFVFAGTGSGMETCLRHASADTCAYMLR